VGFLLHSNCSSAMENSFNSRHRARSKFGSRRCQSPSNPRTRCLDIGIKGRQMARLFGLVRRFLTTAERRHDLFGAESHGVQDFFLGEAAGGDIQHELLRMD
jgi:hypothetical protein